MLQTIICDDHVDSVVNQHRSRTDAVCIDGNRTPSASREQNGLIPYDRGDVLAKVKSQTETVLNTLNSAEQRSRVMGKALRQVEALPELDSARLIPMTSLDTDD